MDSSFNLPPKKPGDTRSGIEQPSMREGNQQRQDVNSALSSALPRPALPTRQPNGLNPATSAQGSRPIEASQLTPPRHPSVPRALGAEESQSNHKVIIGRNGGFFLFTLMITLFAIWIVGPKLVEEYHYAAAIGQARAEHQNAVEQLEMAPLTKVSLAYQLVAQRIKPSVVSLRVFKNGRSGDTEGIGSGVIFSEDGYLVTNAHVVKDGDKFEVKLYNRHVYYAEMVAIDAASDIAVLKIDAPDLIPAEWGDSDAIDVGSMVWAVGSPYGFQHTITMGILSGKNRPGDVRHSKQSLLQTDAAVNPGNSGGPLVDSEGRVIGINTSIFGETFQGISFAVPSSTAKFVFNEIVEKGKVDRGYLGVYPIPIDSRFADILKVPDLDGARLANVVNDSPAARAGIQRGDIIRRWNGTPIRDERELFRLAESTPPNERVNVTFALNRWMVNPMSSWVNYQRLPNLWRRVNSLAASLNGRSDAAKQSPLPAFVTDQSDLSCT